MQIYKKILEIKNKNEEKNKKMIEKCAFGVKNVQKSGDGVAKCICRGVHSAECTVHGLDNSNGTGGFKGIAERGEHAK